MPIPFIAAGAAVLGRVAAGAAARGVASAAGRAGAGAGTQAAAGSAGRMAASSAIGRMTGGGSTEPRSQNFMNAAQMSQGVDVFSANLRPF